MRGGPGKAKRPPSLAASLCPAAGIGASRRPGRPRGLVGKVAIELSCRYVLGLLWAVSGEHRLFLSGVPLKLFHGTGCCSWLCARRQPLWHSLAIDCRREGGEFPCSKISKAS